MTEPKIGDSFTFVDEEGDFATGEVEEVRTFVDRTDGTRVYIVNYDGQEYRIEWDDDVNEWYEEEQ